MRLMSLWRWFPKSRICNIKSAWHIRSIQLKLHRFQKSPRYDGINWTLSYNLKHKNLSFLVLQQDEINSWWCRDGSNAINKSFRFIRVISRDSREFINSNNSRNDRNGWGREACSWWEDINEQICIHNLEKQLLYKYGGWVLEI